MTWKASSQFLELRLSVDGEDRWFSERAIGSGEAGSRRITGSLTDIHERKTAEEQQEKLLEKMTEKNAELERFAYVTSHDLQEPLRMVMNFSELVENEFADNLDEDGKDWLKIISGSARHMSSLIQDILRYSKIENEPDSLIKIDLAEIFEGVRTDPTVSEPLINTSTAMALADAHKAMARRAWHNNT